MTVVGNLLVVLKAVDNREVEVVGGIPSAPSGGITSAPSILLLLLLLLVVNSSGPNRSTNSQWPVGPHPLAPTGKERGTSRFGQLVLGAKGAMPE
jgi:hypothetical protein